MAFKLNTDGSSQIVCDDCMVVLEEFPPNPKALPKSNVRCRECYEKYIEGKKLFYVTTNEAGYVGSFIHWSFDPDDLTEHINFSRPCAKIVKIVELSDDQIESLREQMGYQI